MVHNKPENEKSCNNIYCEAEEMQKVLRRPSNERVYMLHDRVDHKIGKNPRKN